MASYSLPKEQAVKLIFFATWMSYFTKLNNNLREKRKQGKKQSKIIIPVILYLSEVSFQHVIFFVNINLQNNLWESEKYITYRNGY